MTKAKVFVRGLVGFGILATSSAFAWGSGFEGATISNNTPKFVSSSKKMGAVDPTSTVEVSIWLKPHNKAALDALAANVYNRDSASYRHWLSKAEFASKFAPTAEEANAVKNFFTSNNLAVSKVGPDNFYVRAKGTAAAVSSAFHVSLNNYQVDGKIVRANSEDPMVSGEAARLVASVAGLDSLAYSHPYTTRANILRQQTGKPTPPPSGLKMGATAAASNALPASAFNSNCFPGKTTQKFTSSGAQPIATYTGNEYTAAVSGCGYTPANIRAAYNLNALYKEGYDGKGQTVVIIDWCGSPTITQDANAFSAQFGLPALTSKNFTIINTPTPSYCASPDPEINIDVEWAHAIAPGAAIDLVVPPTASFQDVDQGFFYAVDYQLGNVISGSYGSEELYTPTSVLTTENLISEIAAVMGISANFSTGDDGDFTFDLPQYFTASVSAPADSPYATGIGGVSLALNTDNSIKWQSGWGTNVNEVSSEGYVEDPPAGEGFFNFGAGGGPSGYFTKPAYQSKLAGTGRLLPDISWLADPFTGGYIAISEPGVTPSLQYQVYGGTSLACPMFSALWAIANQEAGAPLGQAAPYLYSMPASTITDIVPYSSSTNVTGKVTDSSGTTAYSADSIAAPLENSTKYYSALWDYPLYQDTAIVLTFGTDSGLTTGKGWDNVTGLGVPKDAKAFADYFKAQ